MSFIAIAVDGPSGAGKSSISKMVAAKLQLVYIDTGAMYRAVALKALRTGVSCKEDSEALHRMMEDISITLAYREEGQVIFLDGEDVTAFIRTPEISTAASDISALPIVRKRMVDMQRELATKSSVIMDGRDIGTNVLPNADLKIYLTADVSVRAKRRYLELKDKHPEITLEEVQRDMAQRDHNDATREIAPLRMAEDAILVNTDDMDIPQTVACIENLIREHCHVF